MNSRHPEIGERAAVASHSRTPPEVLAQLAQDPDPNVRARLAENPRTPPEVLALLAVDPVRDVRACVAKNPAATAQTLAQLAVDKNSCYYIMQMAGSNVNTPLDTLEWLACQRKPGQWGVRMGVAENPKAPPDLLAFLAQDDEGWVRYYVRLNPNTPREWKDKLAMDPLPEEYSRWLDD